MTTSHSKDTTPDKALDFRVAWLFPSLERGNYWQPLFKTFCQRYPQTIVYTGRWPGFADGFDGAFEVKVVGKTSLLRTTNTNSGYNRTYIFPSFGIVPKLLDFKPETIFTSAFSIWTAIAILCKLCFGSKVIVLFDGVSPGVDYLNSGFRVFPRRAMSRLIDAYVSNSQAGRDHLIKVAWAPPEKVFTQPYLVPDVSVLAPELSVAEISLDKTQTTFLCVGQIVPRKGLSFLLHACSLLQSEGCDQFSLLIIGEGDERSQLESFTQEVGLAERVHWLGTVEYHRLGHYFKQADVFVFPTLEDIWGMVVSEAMAFGKPILCSKWAGATEVMAEGENGYIFDPYDIEQLAKLMRRFIDQPELVDQMGTQSMRLAAALTPQNAAAFFCDLAASFDR